MKMKTVNALIFLFFLLCLISIILSIYGEYQTILAFWTAIILLLPGLILALRSKFISLKVLSSISFFTQTITVPIFFVLRSEFLWQNVKPFEFKAIEVAKILWPVSLLLVLLALFFNILSHIRIFNIRGSVQNLQNFDQNGSYSIRAFLKPSMHPVIYSILMLITIAIVIPLNLWMFEKGIGLTGIEPPRLPYRLSGILTYFAKYVIPLTLGFFYYKTRHGFFLSIFLLAYGLILGFCTTSKGVLLLTMFPVLIIAFSEKKYRLLAIVGLGTLVAYAFISQVRDFVFTVTDNKSAAITNRSIIDLFFAIANGGKIKDLSFVLSMAAGILNRIEGFENLVMAHYYDPNAVSGAFGFIIRLIWGPLAPINADLHHIQWLGHVLPLGFFNGGALLSTIVIISNDSIFWIVLAAIVIAFILLTLEKSMLLVFEKYSLPKAIGFFIIIILTTTFFVENGGSVIFAMPLLAALILSLLPRIRISQMVSWFVER